jgi:predicted nucleic acid-binding protein
VPFIVDASITMAWCFEDEATPFSDALLIRARQTGVVVPAIWPLEVANTILIGERRQRLTDALTAQFLLLLASLSITIDDQALVGAWGPVLTLAREQGLTAYDATYLELGNRLGLAVATTDGRMRAAADRMGIPLVAEPET